MRRKLKVHVAGKKKWAQKATARMKKKGTKGALHRQLGVAQGKKIGKAKLRAAAKKGGKIGKRARFALNINKRKKKR